MKNWSSVIVISLLIVIFFLGYAFASKIHPCPTIENDTIYLTDTVERTIIDRIPYYYTRTDSVILRDTLFREREVDTIAILADYFAIHYYSRTWEDSLLKVTLEDAITENEPIHNTFKYQILRPQTVIQNILNEDTHPWSIYSGLSLPFAQPNYLEIEAIAAGPKLYFGIGYSPGMKSLTLKAGVRIFDF